MSIPITGPRIALPVAMTQLGSTPNAPVAADAPPLLPPAETTATGDVGLAIATLVINAAFEQKKGARTAKGRAEESRAQAEKQEIVKMHEEADEKFAAAQVDAWMQIGTGAFSLAGAGLAAGGEGLRNAPMANIGKGMSQGGWADVARGIGGLATAGMRDRASDAEAAAKEQGFVVDHAKEASSEATDDMKDAQDSIRKALDFLKDFNAAQSQAQNAAMRRA